MLPIGSATAGEQQQHRDNVLRQLQHRSSVLALVGVCGACFKDPEEEGWEDVESDDDWSMVDSDDMSDDACMCGAAVFPDWPCVCHWRQ